MKKTFVLAAILAGLITAALPAPAARADVSVSFSFFQDSLSPYGQWVTVGSYGRCWYPARVPVGWQPYTVGHWGYGDYGWTWASADPWGDVTYRYGTWTFVPPYGWVWVPGYVWAPAWVTWSYTNDYIGWAPIPPSFSFAVGGYFGAPVVVSRSWYCFVPTRQFAATNVVRVRVPVHENQVLLARSTKVTRFPVSHGIVRNSGIELRNVERVSESRVRRVSPREMRVAPARVETARTSGRRIAVAVPASAKPAVRSAPAEKAARVEKERAPQAPSVRERKAPAPPPSSRERVSRSSQAQPKRDASRPRPKREVSRPSEPRPKKARPSTSTASSPSRPSKQSADTRVRSSSSGREKSRAVAASAPRPPASREVKSSKSSSERPKATKPRPRPSSKEREREKP
jgi:hypothetical protein